MCCKCVSNDDQRGPASKEMAPQTLIPCGGPLWRVIGKARVARCPGRLQTHDQHDRGKHPRNLAQQCAGLSDRWSSGRYEHKFRSIICL
ncbi:hypothetical protein TNCV_1946231 [Trichonephila clavipes]|uniref:Uncharacterized protein n=1 Tax=Trichonephila clavipes TaxID=2585209 RepID=A0A8X6SEP0_TRICX|nr:hypothetical protein TNCV_1946231 [Trichonephila clavipes]